MAESDFQEEPPRRRPPPRRDREGEEVQRERPPRREEEPRRRVRPRDDEEYEEDRPRDAVETLIPYHNPKGLIAYYLGVFSFIPCLGLLLGPAAIILGIMGLRYSQRQPRAGGGGHAIAGLVCGIITTIGNFGVLILFLTGMILSRK
jgi:hypothetical protein